MIEMFIGKPNPTYFFEMFYLKTVKQRSLENSMEMERKNSSDFGTVILLPKKARSNANVFKSMSL